MSQFWGFSFMCPSFDVFWSVWTVKSCTESQFSKSYLEHMEVRCTSGASAVWEDAPAKVNLENREVNWSFVMYSHAGCFLSLLRKWSFRQQVPKPVQQMHKSGPVSKKIKIKMCLIKIIVQLWSSYKTLAVHVFPFCIWSIPGLLL